MPDHAPDTKASMALTLALCTDIQVPILTSPRSGLEAAVRIYRQSAG